jgi:hypothetical protein
MHGAPCELTMSCAFEDLRMREIYNNHPPLTDYMEDVLKKVAKEEHLSHQVLFPRFLWRSKPGLHISPINWVIQPCKEGRYCLDPSSTISQSPYRLGNNLTPRPDTTPQGSTKPKFSNRTPNAQIKDTGADRADFSNPEVHYATAFRRFLIWIWRLCIDNLNTDILLLADDISSAFRLVLYHLVIAVAFASVLQDYLILVGPVGTCYEGDYAWRYGGLLRMPP